MKPASLLSSEFSRQHIVVTQIEGIPLYRFFRSRFVDPLGFGYAPSRFSDPRIDRPTSTRFGVVHLATTFEIAFIETILRDRGDGRIGPLAVPEAELMDWRCARIDVPVAMSLADLVSGPARLKMGIPSDVTGARDQTASQIWSLAIHGHPAEVGGIAWASRLHGGTCYAVYDRALAKLRANAIRPLTGFPRELAALLRRYRIALIP